MRSIVNAPEIACCVELAVVRTHVSRYLGAFVGPGAVAGGRLAHNCGVIEVFAGQQTMQGLRGSWTFSAALRRCYLERGCAMRSAS